MKAPTTPTRAELAKVSIVRLAAARRRADALWVGRRLAPLHTLCYQLLAELEVRHVRTVAIVTGGVR